MYSKNFLPLIVNQIAPANINAACSVSVYMTAVKPPIQIKRNTCAIRALIYLIISPDAVWGYILVLALAGSATNDW